MSFEEAARACAHLDNLPDYMFMFAPKMANQVAKEAEAASRRALKHAVPWDPQMKFQRFIAIQAASFQEWIDQYRLSDKLGAGDVKTGQPRVEIPGTDFYYCHPTLPRNGRLSIASGKRRGNIVFDKPVVVPCLRRTSSYGRDTVWMSLTPMEIFTLRAGIRAASGRVVIAGLGLGYMLIEVSRKRSVRHITLVERDHDLFNWVWPRIRDRVQGNITVLFGDARKIVPKLKADKAVVDIDSSYGGNYFPHCPHIKRVWVWGSAE